MAATNAIELEDGFPLDDRRFVFHARARGSRRAAAAVDQRGLGARLSRPPDSACRRPGIMIERHADELESDRRREKRRARGEA